jgi:acyl-CoA thioester hydrolase
MSITHHSNYVRWMEEARIDFLEQIGWGYDKLEKSGVISPVTAVECKYKVTTTFWEVITVVVEVEEFKGVKLKLKYTMNNEKGELVFEGRSEHCFLDAEGRIVSIKKEYPDFYETLNCLVVKK